MAWGCQRGRKKEESRNQFQKKGSAEHSCVLCLRESKERGKFNWIDSDNVYSALQRRERERGTGIEQRPSPTTDEYQEVERKKEKSQLRHY